MTPVILSGPPDFFVFVCFNRSLTSSALMCQSDGMSIEGEGVKIISAAVAGSCSGLAMGGGVKRREGARSGVREL